MGYIYKILNKINNKIYIGLTKSKNPQTRWLKHTHDYKYAKTYSKRPLYEAMNKYGIENFYFEIIEEIDNSYLSEREIYWIKFYNSYIGFKNSYGYNATLGGDGGHSCLTQQEENNIISLYNNGNSCNRIALLTKHSQEKIAQILKNNGFNIKENKNKVAQLDINTNEVLNIFNSQSEANLYLNKKEKDAHIGEACKGIRKTAYGYKWKYI